MGGNLGGWGLDTATGGLSGIIGTDMFHDPQGTAGMITNFTDNTFGPQFTQAGKAIGMGFGGAGAASAFGGLGALGGEASPFVEGFGGAEGFNAPFLTDAAGFSGQTIGPSGIGGSMLTPGQLAAMQSGVGATTGGSAFQHFMNQAQSAGQLGQNGLNILRAVMPGMTRSQTMDPFVVNQLESRRNAFIGRMGREQADEVSRGLSGESPSFMAQQLQGATGYDGDDVNDLVQQYLSRGNQ